MFDTREAAARPLAEAVVAAAPPDPVVLALPRGGVPLGRIVADALGAPLDLVFVKKIGLPGQRELAAGALVDGASPQTLWNRQVLSLSGLSEADFEDEIAQLLDQIAERRRCYLAGRDPVPLKGRTAILVDDGIATGATVRVAVEAMRKAGVREVWVAVPVAPADIVPALEAEADRVICLRVPDPFYAVGAHYRDFGEVTDEDVIRLLGSQSDLPGTVDALPSGPHMDGKERKT
ncbi:phosphoribosyltransferase family protein [Roseibacterium sp. SDUM158017]|uniref:phosphoribosyltransferase n=1 Tax=Roseicyclus salinarum TaxID=3036773 RepID=UPI0024150E4D|nr:phosphoribosyltransferase family protein [Roseibacterium sp. SDUM158017]MDG4648979.1 phosphoribosyltransferase family protein [Roseibacterium sp. SDUM158017]